MKQAIYRYKLFLCPIQPINMIEGAKIVGVIVVNGVANLIAIVNPEITAKIVTRRFQTVESGIGWYDSKEGSYIGSFEHSGELYHVIEITQ